MFNVDIVLSDDNYIKYDNTFNVQEWLTKQNKPIKDYKILNKYFGDIIDAMCYVEEFSQKLILVSLEREQTLISKQLNKINENILNKAMGCGWTDGGVLKGYSGFERQIRYGINVYKKHFNNAIINEPLEVDHEKIFDNNTQKYKWIARNIVIPRNRITYALYKYTPHIGDKRSPLYEKIGGAYGCYATYLIAQKWFNWS